MNTKYCSGCSNNLPRSEFSKKGKNKIQSLCRLCHRKAMRNHYNKNKDYYIAKSHRRRDELREWFKSLKRTLCCNKCAENDPACIQFHHTDPSIKEIDLSIAINQCWSRARILREIEKCEILCANCHCKEHSTFN